MEEIEQTRSKKVKSYKKRLIRAMEKYREIEERCMRAEQARGNNQEFQEVNFLHEPKHSQVSS